MANHPIPEDLKNAYAGSMPGTWRRELIERIASLQSALEEKEQQLQPILTKNAELGYEVRDLQAELATLKAENQRLDKFFQNMQIERDTLKATLEQGELDRMQWEAFLHMAESLGFTKTKDGILTIWHNERAEKAEAALDEMRKPVRMDSEEYNTAPHRSYASRQFFNYIMEFRAQAKQKEPA